MPTTQGIKLDDVTSSRLKALGSKRDRSPHWLMRKAIEIYLDREERYEAEKAEESWRSTKEYLLTGQAIDNTVVLAWLSDLAHDKITPCPK